jgi:transcriptional regulator with XRE-family HTH domain
MNGWHYDYTNIKSIRATEGLTMQQCADMLEIKYQQWQQWETGKVIPSAEKLADIATILKCSILHFYNDTRTMEQRLQEKWQ